MKMRLPLALLLASIVLVRAEDKSAPEKPKPAASAAADSFQWIEEPKSAETGAYLAHLAMQAVVKNRPEIAQRLTEMILAGSAKNQCAQEGVYFFAKGEGNKKQASIYRRKGLQGTDERLIDAGKLSGAKDASLTIADSANEAGLLIYGVHEGDAEEQVVHIFDLKSGRDLPDTLPRARYSSINLSPDKKGIYYARVDPAGTHVYFHGFGADVADDKLIFGDSYYYEPLGPTDAITLEVTQNGEFLLLSVARGMPVKRVDVYSQEQEEPDEKIRMIIHAMDNHFSVVNHEKDLFVLTDNKAPKNRVVKIAIDDPSPLKWQEIVPGGNDLISNISIVGEKLFVSDIRDGITRARIFTLEGKEMGEVTYPELGFEKTVHHRCPLDQDTD